MGTIWINGTNLQDEFKIVASGNGTEATPARNILQNAVDGRNGDIVFDKGNFNNLNIEYECYISHNFKQHFQRFKEFLYTLKGYFRLEDSYRPYTFRMAHYPTAINPKLTKSYDGGTFTLVFNCKPQIFYSAGETPIEIEAEEVSEAYVSPKFRNTPITYAQVIANYNPNNHDDYRILKERFIDVIPNLPTDTVFICAMINGAAGKVWDFSQLSGYANNKTVIAGVIERAGHMGHKHEQADNKLEYFRFVSNTGQIVYYTVSAPYQTIYANGELMYQTGDMYRATVENPYAFATKPLIKIKFKQNVPDSGRLLSINGKLIRNISLPTPAIGDLMELYVDCETGQSYYVSFGEYVNASPYIYTDEVRLEVGDNEIIYANVDLDITPRWWTV